MLGLVDGELLAEGEGEEVEESEGVGEAVALGDGDGNGDGDGEEELLELLPAKVIFNCWLFESVTLKLLVVSLIVNVAVVAT